MHGKFVDMILSQHAPVIISTSGNPSNKVDGTSILEVFNSLANSC